MPVIKMTDGPDINVVRTGKTGGVPIVFLHALGLDLSVWEPQFETLGKDFDLIGIDLPGHGLSGPMDAAPGFVALAGIVVDVLDHLRIASAHLVGVSVGGMIAQALAVNFAGRVSSMSLVATSCTFPDAVRKVLRDRAALVRHGGMQSITPQHLQRWFPQRYRQMRPDVLDRLGKILLRQDPQWHACMWDMVVGLDFEQQLAAVRCPVMVVAGEEDMSAPPDAGRAIVERIAGAVLHVIPGCGHFPQLEYPGHFNQLIKAFLLPLENACQQ